MKKLSIFIVVLIAIVMGLVITPAQVQTANASPLVPFCQGDGTAQVDILYGLQGGVGSTYFTASGVTVTYPSNMIGFQVISDNPSRYNQEWVISTDANQTNVIDSTRIMGFTFNSEGAIGPGFQRWEWNGGSVNRSFDTDYYFSVRLYLLDGTQFACSPVLKMPAISQTDATTYGLNGLQSVNPFYGSNPYLPGGLFDWRPKPPVVEQVELTQTQEIAVPATVETSGEVSSVEYSTDGGTTWAPAPLVDIATTYGTAIRTNSSSTAVFRTALYSTNTGSNYSTAVASSSLNASFNLAKQSNGAALTLGQAYKITLRGLNDQIQGERSNDICYTMGNATGIVCPAAVLTDPAASPVSESTQPELADTGSSEEYVTAWLITGLLFSGMVLIALAAIRRKRF